MKSAAYQPVVGNQQDDDDNNNEINMDEEFYDEDEDDEPQLRSRGSHTTRTTRTMEPLEIGSSYSGEGNEDSMIGDDDDDDDESSRATARHSNKSHLDDIVWPHVTLSVTYWLVVPSLVAAMVQAYLLLGRIWTCSLFALHLTLALIKARCHVGEIMAVVSPPKMAATTTAMRIIGNNPHHTTINDNNQPYRDDHVENLELEGGQNNNNNNIDTAMQNWEPPYSTAEETTPAYSFSYNKGMIYFWVTSLPSLIDILLFGAIYPSIAAGFRDNFGDSDGTVIVEWKHYAKGFQVVVVVGYIVCIFRLCMGGRMLLVRRPASTYYITTAYYTIRSTPVLGTCLELYYFRVWLPCKAWFRSPPRPILCWHVMTISSTLLSVLFLGWTLYSLIVHFEPSFEPTQPHDDPLMCDPLDKTECCLPFPSFYHLQEDSTTETGYRVHLKPESFPMLKGRIPIPVNFLNTLDGFSTMGPLLFYLDGMKESHEVYVKGLIQDNATLKTQVGATQLRGHEDIALSVTPYSTTLLLDVAARELVPHSAEIDYLDPARPLVMVYPALPLKHNAQYALAVINATNARGERLPPSQGLLDILDGPINSINGTGAMNDPTSVKRRELFTKAILPALEAATHKVSAMDTSKSHDWGGPFGSFLRNNDPMALQLLFDFHTASKASQLGPVRAVRDHTIKYIQRQWNNKWDDHVQVIRQIDGKCRDPNYPLARTIHGELDVPWFLAGYGPGYRGAKLDPDAVESGVHTTIGKAKFVVHIPCSLRQAALRMPPDPSTNMTSQKLRAFVEYGHGLFYNRAESGETFLVKLADRNGYIMTAMDWRGMSQYDFPVVARTMLSDPSLFASIRDNLIQGYANKFALQHFTQNGLLSMPSLKFANPPGANSDFPYLHDIPFENGKDTPPSMFYGVSQGGILGAGYVGLSGSTGLISRATLGVPGTPFSLVLSRSLQFVGYDQTLLLNFYNNRHVRIFLSFAQMCWDSVEAAGVLGQPVEEPIPRILLQAGLGDPIVPTLAAERLARGLGAQILPNNPRSPIFGIGVGQPSDDQQDGPQSTLTEILYKKEYASLPVDDELTEKNNDVHYCVRMEPVLQGQIEEFFNTGKIIDPCAENLAACIRMKASCFDNE